MNNRIIMLLLALGVCPTTYAQDASSTDKQTGQLVIPTKNLHLHMMTKLILQRLKDMGALSILEDQDGPKVVILGDRLDDEFFAYLSHFKNVTQVENSKELVISDSLAAALSAFGELNDVEDKDEVLLKKLQSKIGPQLDETLKLCSATSFS